MKTRWHIALAAGAAAFVLALPGAAYAAPQCRDGVDNDLDGKIGYPADPGCSNKNDSTENTDQPQPVGQSGWRGVFDDEFSGTALDANRWRTNVTWYIGISCQDNANNISVSGSLLHLMVRRGQSSWCPYSDYSGALIQNGQWADPTPFAMTYGYAEARVKIAPGQGLWPAVWMANTGEDNGGEIDLIEWQAYNTTLAFLTVHWPNQGGYQQTSITDPDWAGAFHVIAVDWEPGLVVWYVDGVERYRVTDSRVPSQREYLLLDHAVTDAWPGPPDPSVQFPADFQVDYYRAWQR